MNIREGGGYKTHGLYPNEREGMPSKYRDDLIGETICGIEIRSRFPDNFNSPDPVKLIEKVVEYGLFSQAANDMDVSYRTVVKWGNKYPELQEAYEKGSKSIYHKAENTLYELMANEEQKGSVRYRAACKILATNAWKKDYSTKERRVITDDTEEGKKQKMEKLEGADAKEAKQLFDELSQNGHDE